MEFAGVIKSISKEETIGEKGLRKVTVVLEEVSDKEYKSSMAVDFFNDKIDLVKAHKVGDQVKVLLNFRSREYNGKFYNSISAWKVEGSSGGSSSGSSSSSQDDDLPF